MRRAKNPARENDRRAPCTGRRAASLPPVAHTPWPPCYRSGVVYDCRGNGPPLSSTLLGEGSEVQADAKGKVVVDEHLRCAASPTATPGRVFAAGDVMRLPGCKDLKVGHTAELNADVVAANIRAAAKGEAAPPHLEEYAAYLPSPLVSLLHIACASSATIC